MTDRLKNFVPLAEIASAIAVVVSLIFVGLEIRNNTEQATLNTRSLEIAAYQELIQNILELNRIGLQDPAIAKLNIKAHMSPGDLTEVERLQFNHMLWVHFRHGDMAYFQYERGAMNEIRLRSTLAPLINKLSSPYVRQRWAIVQHNFVESYRNYINGLIDATPVQRMLEPSESE